MTITCHNAMQERQNKEQGNEKHHKKSSNWYVPPTSKCVGHGHDHPGKLKKHKDGNKVSAAGKDVVNIDKDSMRNEARERSVESPRVRLSSVLRDHKGSLNREQDKDEELLELATKITKVQKMMDNDKEGTKCEPQASPTAPNKELVEGDAKATKVTKEPKMIKGGKQCDAIDSKSRYVVCKASELKVVGKASSTQREGESESGSQDYDEHRASSRGWEHHHCEQRKQCCTSEDGSGEDKAEGKKDGDSSSGETDTAPSCSTCSSKDLNTKDSCKEDVCCSCGHNKKGAPVSRNYTKMRNRLRGILERKREIVEYFEHHPAKPERRNSQPQQVIFKYHVIQPKVY